MSRADDGKQFVVWATVCYSLHFFDEFVMISVLIFLFTFGHRVKISSSVLMSMCGYADMSSPVRYFVKAVIHFFLNLCSFLWYSFQVLFEGSDESPGAEGYYSS